MHIEPGSTIVFVGPSLPRHEAEGLLPAVYLPPVQQGAVYRATFCRPRTIVILDGYFSWVPAVWHKEILWALTQGIAVYGASSMGALRAVELKGFGMIGHGWVYEAYASGLLEDDDEVAIVHADAEIGFQPLSDAMVNIRVTLADAVHAGVISPDIAAALIAEFKRRHFPERCFRPALASPALRALLPNRALDDLQHWLEHGYRDVKQEDARSLLRFLALEPSQICEPATEDVKFQATVNWLHLAESVHGNTGAERVGIDASMSEPLGGRDEVLVELRLEGGWPALEAQALARLVVASPVVDRGPVSESEYIEQLARICVRRELPDMQALLAWARDSGWSPDRLGVVASREALLARASLYWASEVRSVACDLLLLDGRAEPLLVRSRSKNRWLRLSANDVSQPDVADAIAWYRQRCGMKKNSSAELARLNGWSSAEDMIDDLLIEYAYRLSQAFAQESGES